MNEEKDVKKQAEEKRQDDKQEKTHDVKKENKHGKSHEKRQSKNHEAKCGCGEGKCDCNEEKIKKLEEALLRKDADMVNYRKRKEEEVARMLKYSNEDIAKDLLPIVDNFERAISMDDDDLTDELSKFLEGFKMIYCHLTDVLNKFEIKAIDGNKKPFDPNYHQAVLTEKVEGMEPGMVIEVLQKGYLLKDRVIRTAMVKVSE